jgi:hypothetical protein
MTIQEDIAADQAALAAAQAKLAADQAALDAITPHLGVLQRLEEYATTLESEAKDKITSMVTELRGLFGA